MEGFSQIVGVIVHVLCALGIESVHVGVKCSRHVLPGALTHGGRCAGCSQPACMHVTARGPH